MLPALVPAPLASPLAEVIHSLIAIPIAPSLRPVWLGGRSSSGSGASSPSGSKANQGPVDRALSAFAASRRSFSRSGSPNSSTPSVDIIARVHGLLEVSTNHYLPGTMDPDDIKVRELCKKEGDSSLDDILSPLVLLVTRLALADEITRGRIRDILIPVDLDRTRPLETRADLLGRCLRLLGSIHHARLKDVVGEMFFAICDSDRKLLSLNPGVIFI